MAALIWVSGAMAQEAAEQYAPPPLFDAPSMNAQEANPAAASPNPAFRPRYSPAKPVERPKALAPENKYTGTNNPLLPPVVTQGDPALEKKPAPKKEQPVVAPRPPAKPKQPAAAAAPQTKTPAIETPKVAAPAPAKVDTPAPAVIEKPQPAPIASPAAPEAPAPMPAARVTSEGVVKGPKTMPSVPTTDVAAETVFEAPAAPAETLMERHQAQQAADMPADVPADGPAPVAPAAPPLSDQPLQVSDKGIEKLTVPFERGIADVQNPPIASLIQSLKDDPAKRLMIQAYGTATDAGENSDRRIALARALNLRKAIVSQQIDSHRIDVRALGKQTRITPVDRVDLLIYKPQEAAN